MGRIESAGSLHHPAQGQAQGQDCGGGVSAVKESAHAEKIKLS